MLIYLCDASPGERHNHSHHIDRQLELQKLGNTIVHVASPHYGFDDTGEVVICKNDVRGLLCNIGASNSLLDKACICFSEI